MSFDLDWTALGQQNPRKDRLAYDDNKHLFRKVAWDAYKPLTGSDILWELREESDGKYLYAVYEKGPELVASATDSGDISTPITATAMTESWSAIRDNEGKNITLSFMNIPIKRFSAAEYHFTPSEAVDFEMFLKTKTSEAGFVDKLMKTLPEAKQLAVAKILNQRGA